MQQEPGTSAEIKARVMSNHSIKFALLDKIEVNGAGTHNVYKFLRSAPLENQSADKNAIEWNFTKFIVDQTGKVQKRFPPNVDPRTFDRELPDWLSGLFF